MIAVGMLADQPMLFAAAAAAAIVDDAMASSYRVRLGVGSSIYRNVAFLNNSIFITKPTVGCGVVFLF